MSLIILQVIPSLIGYILIVQLFNCATWSLFPEHHFRLWAKLTSIFLVISFRLEQQAWFWVCVVLVVPITFRFISPLTWCHRRSITPPWNLSTNVSWSSSTFWALPGYQFNSWWEIPSLPSMICVVIDHFIAFRSTQTCSCVVLYLEILLSNICSLPWSITICYVKNVVRISPPLENSWYIITSYLLRSFLGPSLLFLTGILTTGLWCVNSKLLATLLLWSEW